MAWEGSVSSFAAKIPGPVYTLIANVHGPVQEYVHYSACACGQSFRIWILEMETDISCENPNSTHQSIHMTI